MKKVEMDTDMVSTPGPMTKNPYQNSSPVRAMEPHMDSEMGANHTGASRVPGAGINFGRVGNKPDHSNAVPRDAVASRNASAPNPKI
jgi:hypothetical protein